MDSQERKEINKLIVEIGKGREDALILLYERLGGRMLSVAQGITRDRGLAEDAVQEALLKIVRYAKSFQKQDNGYGWVQTIVRNESLTIVRRYRPNHANVDEFYSLAEMRNTAGRMFEHTDIQMALLRLTPDDRHLIWLRYVCDMTVREIAKEVGHSKSAVGNQLQKAEKTLKMLLE